MEEITIDNEYGILKKYYDEVLNKDKRLVKTSNDEPTPITCVEEMVNKIPEAFWKRKNIKILDPCCGCGNFPFVIYHKLNKYHTKKYIISKILHFNDINKDRLVVLKSIFNDEDINIYEQDFTTFTADIKFDLIVANPPYAKLLPNGKRASKNHNLIGVFIQKSLEYLNKSGYLLYITPDNWMSYADRNTLILELTNLQIHYINIHIPKKYFKKVGSSFTWYLIENTKSYKDIEIEGIWKKKLYKSVVRSEKRHFIPLYYNNLIQNIINKTIDNSGKKFVVETSSDLHKYTKKRFISSERNDVYKYKLIHTPNQTVWSSKPHKYQEGYKVFISTTSYYSTFVDNCGMTQSVAFIRCSSKEKAEKISNVLNHPLYIFMNNICRYGNFNNIRIMQKFPYCEDYDNVYKKFGISEEEIEFIQENV
tara:strand:+ start:557 stop:1822 length:1266 start_codon:yes stop_codon:yes gene_type:complete